MRRLLVFSAASVAVVLLAVPGASAFPPKTAVRGIVFNKNIGAMKLGMTKAQAIKAWGAGSGCKVGDGDNFCFWSDADGQAGIKISGGRVRSISIIRKKKGGHLEEFTFEPEVRLGSTRAQVRNSFRQFPPPGKVERGKVDRVTSPDGKRETAFIFTGTRLTAILMQRVVSASQAAAETKCKPNILEFLGRRNSNWTFGGGQVYGITAENTSCQTAKFVAVRYLKFLAGVKPRLTGYTVKKVAGKLVYRKGSAVIRFYASADKSRRTN